MGDSSVNNIYDNILSKKGTYHMCENTGYKGNSLLQYTYAKEQEFVRFLGKNLK